MKGSCEESSSCIDGVCVEDDLNVSYNFFFILFFCFVFFHFRTGSGFTSEALLWTNKDFPFKDLSKNYVSKLLCLE